jgi:polysaccharide biosynthesis transport protein
LFPDDAFEPTLLGAARKHWRLVLVFAIGGLVAAWLIHSALASAWVAEASMVVENPENSQLFDEQAAGSPERYTADQVAIIESTPVATRALEIAEETSDAGPFDLGELVDGVDVESTLESGLIEVVAANDDPDKAVVVANATVTAYQETKEAATASGFESAITEFDDSIAAVDAELEDITAQITELRTTGEDGNVDAQLQAAIGELLGLLDEPATQAAPELEVVLQQLQTLQLIRSVQAEDPELASLNESRTQALERRSQLALRRDQLRVDAALTSTGIVLVSPAQAADQSIGLPRALAFGLLLGAVLGAVAALATATRSHRFNHRSEPELFLNTPLLAEVPHFGEESLDTDLPSIDAPDSSSAEALRFAVGALGVGAKSEDGPTQETAHTGPGVVGVASPSLGDGKSVLAANLAATATLLGSKVLLVDCDFGDPGLAKLFGAPTDTVGMTDVVDDGLTLDQAITRIRIDDDNSFDLLTRGSRNVTAPGFFRSAQTAEFFADLRKRYDLVIVDTPPVLQVAYTGTVLGLCDRVAFVVPHHSDVSRLAEAAERLYLANASADGYIYNRAPLREENWADDRLRSARALVGTVRTGTTSDR